MKKLIVVIILVTACLLSGCGTPVGKDGERLPDKTRVGGQAK